MRMRKTEREALKARVLEVIKKNPDITSHWLAVRFNVSQSYICNLTKAAGIKLLKHEVLTASEVKHLREPKDPNWGYRGVVG